MKRYGLRDDQFARIETLLPGRPGTVGRSSERGNRLFVEAVIWKFRSGAPWRDLPERFGGKTPTSAFRAGPQAGFGRVFSRPLADDPDNEYAMIDATIVKAHQHSAGARKKGVRPSHRPIARRPYDKNPRDRRRAWQSTGAQSHRWQCSRHHPGGIAGGPSRARRPSRRQGI
jgi:transposase